MKQLTIAQVKAEVDEIIAAGDDDPARSHEKQDLLLINIALSFAPPKVADEVRRLHAANLTRWYS